MSSQDLQIKIRELRELQRMAEEIKTEIDTLQDDIKAEMTLRNTDELTAGEYKIRWTSVISNRFDTKSFQEKYQGLYNKFLKRVQSKRFSIV